MLVDQKIPLLALMLCMAQRPIPAAETQQLATDLYSVIQQDTITSQLVGNQWLIIQQV